MDSHLRSIHAAASIQLYLLESIGVGDDLVIIAKKVEDLKKLTHYIKKLTKQAKRDIQEHPNQIQPAELEKKQSPKGFDFLVEKLLSPSKSLQPSNNSVPAVVKSSTRQISSTTGNITFNLSLPPSPIKLQNSMNDDSYNDGDSYGMAMLGSINDWSAFKKYIQNESIDFEEVERKVMSRHETSSSTTNILQLDENAFVSPGQKSLLLPSRVLITEEPEAFRSPSHNHRSTRTSPAGKPIVNRSPVSYADIESSVTSNVSPAGKTRTEHNNNSNGSSPMTKDRNQKIPLPNKLDLRQVQ